MSTRTSIDELKMFLDISDGLETQDSPQNTTQGSSSSSTSSPNSSPTQISVPSSPNPSQSSPNPSKVSPKPSEVATSPNSSQPPLVVPKTPPQSTNVSISGTDSTSKKPVTDPVTEPQKPLDLQNLGIFNFISENKNPILFGLITLLLFKLFT